jgi:hypothetical protein
MSVTFSATQTPMGWRLSCAFDERLFPTWEEARTAAAAHPADGCEAGKAWYVAHTGADGFVPSENEDALREATGRWADACRDWVYAEAVYAEEAPWINLSQSNAAALLRALGYCETRDAAAQAAKATAPQNLGEVFSAMCPDDVQWCGHATPDEMIGRALLASAIDSDAGVPSSSYRLGGSSGPTVITDGRPVGYLEHRLAQIIELAEWCKQRELHISWS